MVLSRNPQLGNFWLPFVQSYSWVIDWNRIESMITFLHAPSFCSCNTSTSMVAEGNWHIRSHVLIVEGWPVTVQYRSLVVYIHTMFPSSTAAMRQRHKRAQSQVLQSRFRRQLEQFHSTRYIKFWRRRMMFFTLGVFVAMMWLPYAWFPPGISEQNTNVADDTFAPLLWLPKC